MKKWIQLLIGTGGLFLLAAGINFFLYSSLTGITKAIMGGLLVVDGLMYIALILLVDHRGRLVRIGWIAVVGVNLLMTVMDNLGAADLFFLLINVTALGLYIKALY